MHRNFRKICEYLFILSSILIICFFSLLQLSIITLAPKFYISVKDIDNFYLIVFQVQATVSMLGITVLSIISGISSTKYYGINVANYILNLRPAIMKHNYLVLVNLVLILINLVLCSLRLFNLCTAIFIISILICMKMFADVYNVFRQQQSIKSEMFDYLLLDNDTSSQSYNKQYQLLEHNLVIVSSDLDSSILLNDITSVKDDVRLINSLLSRYVNIRKLNNILSEPKQTSSSVSFFNLYKNSLSNLLNTSNEIYLILYLDSMAAFVATCNKLSLEFDVVDEVFSALFIRLSTINPVILLTNNSLRDFRSTLYNNLDEDFHTWYCIIDFLSFVYSALSSNLQFKQLPLFGRMEIWNKLIFTDTVSKDDLSPKTLTRFLTKPRSLELMRFYTLLIENSDVSLLSYIFPIRVRSYFIINLSVLAYLYNAIYKNTKPAVDSNIFTECLSSFGNELYYNIYHSSYEVLLHECISIKYFLLGSYIVNDETQICSFIFSTFETEFIFFYVLCHICCINEFDIERILEFVFKDYKLNFYKEYYFDENKKQFKNRFTNFTERVFGSWSLKLDSKLFEKVYAFYTSQFSSIESQPHSVE